MRRFITQTQDFFMQNDIFIDIEPTLYLSSLADNVLLLRGNVILMQTVVIVMAYRRNVDTEYS